MTERPIESRPVEVLLDGGRVVRKSGGNRYFGPDAHVLLSDEFLDTHCMQLRAGTNRLPTWSGWSSARFGSSLGGPGSRVSSGCRVRRAAWNGSSSAT